MVELRLWHQNQATIVAYSKIGTINTEWKNGQVLPGRTLKNLASPVETLIGGDSTRDSIGNLHPSGLNLLRISN
jgi:hypothetical protein